MFFHLFKKRPKYWKTPGGLCFENYEQIANGGHLVIAGATGSGKSTVLRELIYTFLLFSPSKEMLMLIDPKRVDLRAFRDLPHIVEYANTPATTVESLNRAVGIMRARYSHMERLGLCESEEPRINVIVDEVADLLSGTNAKEIRSKLIEIARLGRAARVRLIIATQAPSRKTLPAELVQNCDRLALRCFDAIESRQILGISGAEFLPQYGRAIYRRGSQLFQTELKMLPKEEAEKRISYWRTNNKPRKIN